ncbi:hypothetical protein PIB30_066570 [Stylosanthes scabra]|uniref:Uncharacterized protein n=1 Tax=Stylosanthes scabra TaxID=79078 RepID=A0ABU6RM91_9FABA|nr:hypothetical protein [Stylosanthes scabra]
MVRWFQGVTLARIHNLFGFRYDDLFPVFTNTREPQTKLVCDDWNASSPYSELGTLGSHPFLLTLRIGSPFVILPVSFGAGRSGSPPTPLPRDSSPNELRQKD